MKIKLLLLMVLLLHCICSWTQPATMSAKTFVTSTHTQGIPYGQAKACNNKVIPELVRMLNNIPYWDVRLDIVSMFGITGDVSAINLKKHQNKVHYS